MGSEMCIRDSFNIEQNIDAGTRHIKEYIDMFGGSIEMGLMAYNGGPGTVSYTHLTLPTTTYVEI
ncbi:Transglycosylase SLT domain protein [Clostridioides difficile]|nr:Transglycosylase SLT domain protein [Clostridioides difficile]